MASSVFAGESFLQVSLPNYEWGATWVGGGCFVSFFLWILVFPAFLSSTRTETVERTVTERRPTKRPRHHGKTKVSSDEFVTRTIRQEVTVRDAPFWVTLVSALGFVASCCLVLACLSPYNAYLTRRVFAAPLLTEAECREIIERSMAAAARNAERAAQVLSEESSDNVLSHSEQTTLEGLLEEPVGWSKARHGSYPTTDLNLVTDPFTEDDHVYVGDLLNRRLGPLLARVFGIPETSIRANDLFVVRYDALNGGRYRTRLANHTDDGHISINILLNRDFEGGGTRFWNRHRQQPFAHVTPTEPGTLLAHGALIHHEGYTISEGTRFILVGFLSVDAVDPWRGSASSTTGLSWLASWANGCWLPVMLKTAVHNGDRKIAMGQPTTNFWEAKYARHFLADFYHGVAKVMDQFATHAVEDLVHPTNKTAFLQALDRGYATSNSHKHHRGASWFDGQGINVNIDGTIESEWDTREQHAKRVSRERRGQEL